MEGKNTLAEKAQRVRTSGIPSNRSSFQKIFQILLRRIDEWQSFQRVKLSSCSACPWLWWCLCRRSEMNDSSRRKRPTIPSLFYLNTKINSQSLLTNRKWQLEFKFHCEILTTRSFPFGNLNLSIFNNFQTN